MKHQRLAVHHSSARGGRLVQAAAVARIAAALQNTLATVAGA